MAEIVSIGRRNEADYSQYPFADDATLVTATGLALDPDAIIDAIAYPPGATAGVRITSILRATGSVVLSIGDRLAANLATTAFDPAAPPSILRLFAGTRPAGILVVDPVRLAAFQAWPLGLHTFAVGAAEFVASAVVPTPASLGVTAIKVGDVAVSGDVWLLGKDGVTLSITNNAIRIDLTGDPLWARRGCQEAGVFTAPRLLKTITVIDPVGVQTTVVPDVHGMIHLLVSDVYAADTTLRIAADGTDGVKISVAGSTIANT